MGWAVLILHLAMRSRDQGGLQVWRLKPDLWVWFAKGFWSLLVVNVLVDFCLGRAHVFHASMQASELLAAALVFEAALRWGADARLRSALWWALCIGGVGQCGIGVIQMFVPGWIDGLWVMAPLQLGRSVGNVQQPNQLGTLLMWSSFAVGGLALLGQIRWWFAALCWFMLTAVLVWTGSRTGLVALGLFCAWGLLQSGLTRRLRCAACVQPAWALLVCAATVWWSHHFGGLFYANSRAAQSGGDVTSGRKALWSACTDLIMQHPWAGLGAGRFKFAWLFSDLPDRHAGVYGHSHNLVLQWVLDFGLPRAVALTTCLALLVGTVLWRWLITRRRSDSGSTALAGPWLGILLVVLFHAQLEHPLTFAYLLLPAAWALGASFSELASCGGCVDAASAGGNRHRVDSPSLAMAAAVALLAGCFVLHDYLLVSATGDPERAPWWGRTQLFEGLVDEGAILSRDHSSSYQLIIHRALNALEIRGNPVVLARLSEAYCGQGQVSRALYTWHMLQALRMPESPPLQPCQRDEGDAPWVSPGFESYWEGSGAGGAH